MLMQIGVAKPDGMTITLNVGASYAIDTVKALTKSKH